MATVKKIVKNAGDLDTPFRTKPWDGVGIPFNIIFCSFITGSIIRAGHEKFPESVDNGESMCYNKSAESRMARPNYLG